MWANRPSVHGHIMRGNDIAALRAVVTMAGVSNEAIYMGVLHYGRSEQMLVGFLLRVDSNGTREIVNTGEVSGMAKTERELLFAAGLDQKWPVAGALVPDLTEGSPRIHPHYGASIKIYRVGCDSRPVIPALATTTLEASRSGEAAQTNRAFGSSWSGCA